MNVQQIRAAYDRRAPSYDRTIGVSERVLLGQLRQAFAAELHGDTLEVAIGSGLNLPFCPSTVRRATGVDVSRAMLDRAAARARDLGLRIDLMQMDAERLAFADATFNSVGVSLALCTIPDPVAALREIARVCRPDGRVILLEHGRSPVWPIFTLERLVSPLQERFIGCHLTRETVETARRIGFVPISDRQRLFGVVRLVVMRPPPVGSAQRSSGKDVARDHHYQVPHREGEGSVGQE